MSAARLALGHGHTSSEETMLFGRQQVTSGAFEQNTWLQFAALLNFHTLLGAHS